MFFMTRGGQAGFQSFCNIGQTFDCTAIEMSRYAELWTGYPLSALAVAAYLLMLFLSFQLWDRTKEQVISKILVGLSSVSVLFSVFYLYVMIAIVQKGCVLCLVVDVVNVALLIASIKLYRSTQNHGPSPYSPLKALMVSGAIAIVIAFLAGKALDPQAQVQKSDITDLVDSILSTPVTDVVIPSSAPIVGNPNAPITIIKFSDFQCPACRMGATALHPILKKYPKEVRFVFLHYPLDSGCNPEMKRPMHEAACEAASLAICAQKQGAFYAAYETLFDLQEKLAPGKTADLLNSISGLDVASLKTCASESWVSEKIRADVSLGASLKIQSTPTFFLNGLKIEGGLPTSVWIELIERLLKK
jgi:protein-disulfide isomerase